MTRSRNNPPRMAEWLLTRFVPDSVVGRSIIGDAREEYHEHARSGSRVPAALWYWKHVLAIVFRFVASGSGDRIKRPTGTGGGFGTRSGNLFGDLRVAVRMLLRKPGFTLAAVGTLGLGIGANTIIFSLVNGVLLRPLPYPEAGRLVSVYRIDPEVTGRNPAPERLANLYSVPYEVYLDWSEMSSVFESDGAYFTTGFTLTGGDRPERLSGAMATAGVFRALGINPQLGRVFLPADDAVGAPALAVLSHGLWVRRFAADPNVLGGQLTLNGLSYQVVGVMPPRFSFPREGIDVWVTFEDERKTSPVRSSGYLQVVARIQSGMTLQDAQHDVNTVAARIGDLHPEEIEHGIGLFPRKSLEVAGVRGGLVLLLGAVGLVLLIACANIANLLLVRASERRRELGVRLALGAGRGRLLAQHLSESVVLSLAGGVAGCLLAFVGLDPFKAAYPGGLPRADAINVDHWMLLFAGGLSVLTGLMTGLLPAVQALKTPIVDVLREGSRSAAGGRQQSRTRSALVVTEIALAFVLLVGAGLFLRSLSRLTSVEYGFDSENLVTTGIALPARYRESDEASLGFFAEFGERLRAIPGVQSVGTVNQMPFVGGWSTPPAVVETSDGFVETIVHYEAMSPEYFETMGMRIIAGRGLTEGDRRGNALVTVVNQAMVDRFWPNENPIGRTVGVSATVGDSAWITVVGVVSDVRFRLNMDPFPTYHVPLAQWPHWYQWVVLRTAIEPTAITPAIQEMLAAIDPDVPIRVQQLEERVLHSDAVAGPRFGVFILGCLAGLAALLACIGIYGVIAYTVQQRAHEIGIRMALGAGASDVVRGLLGHGLAMAGVGVGVGVALAVGVSRVLSSLLFEISATDPATLAAVAGLIVAAALLASFVPARRATTVSPVEVLKQD